MEKEEKYPILLQRGKSENLKTDQEFLKEQEKSPDEQFILVLEKVSENYCIPYFCHFDRALSAPILIIVLNRNLWYSISASPLYTEFQRHM